jgi:hypothetical protein
MIGRLIIGAALTGGIVLAAELSAEANDWLGGRFGVRPYVARHYGWQGWSNADPNFSRPPVITGYNPYTGAYFWRPGPTRYRNGHVPVYIPRYDRTGRVLYYKQVLVP